MVLWLCLFVHVFAHGEPTEKGLPMPVCSCVVPHNANLSLFDMDGADGAVCWSNDRGVAHEWEKYSKYSMQLHHHQQTLQSLHLS